MCVITACLPCTMHHVYAGILAASKKHHHDPTTGIMSKNKGKSNNEKAAEHNILLLVQVPDVQCERHRNLHQVFVDGSVLPGRYIRACDGRVRLFGKPQHPSTKYRWVGKPR